MAARRRSIVWSFFQAEDERRVLCLLCMKTVLYFGHTTNMLRHLRTKHPSDFSSLDKRKPAADVASKRNDSGCVEVTVLMDEQQVEVESVGEDGEMDGAIKGILRAAAGEGAVETEGADEDVMAPVEEGDGKEIQEEQTPGDTRKWSSVWVHYRKLGQETRALCLLCMEKIQHRSSTSNLIRHLQNRHPTEFAQLEDHPQKRPTKRKADDAGCPSGTPARAPYVTPKRDVRPTSSAIIDKLPGSRWSEGVRLLERERELTDALRRVQQEEGRSIQLQKELLQQFREMDAERRVLLNQKCEQEQETSRLRKEREDFQMEKNELQREREEIVKEREEILKGKEEILKEREEILKEREELEKQKHELDSWKNANAQGQNAGFYTC